MQCMSYERGLHLLACGSLGDRLGRYFSKMEEGVVFVIREEREISPDLGSPKAS